jgi:hypothetical protein
MLRLHRLRPPVKHRNEGAYCVLRFPDSIESRWLDRVPTPGTRIRSHGGHGYWGRMWIVDEVLQSGNDTYTVTCVGRAEYLDKLRNGPGFKPNLAAELLELARRTRDTVTEQRRTRKYRHYVP